MCHVLVTVFPPLYRSLSKRVPVGRVREHHTLPTHLSSKNHSHLHMQKKKEEEAEVRQLSCGCLNIVKVLFVKLLSSKICSFF